MAYIWFYLRSKSSRMRKVTILARFLCKGIVCQRSESSVLRSIKRLDALETHETTAAPRDCMIDGN